MQQTIYLIRHTTPEVEKGICYGQTDLDVKDSFLAEAQEIMSIVPNHRQIPLYSSPLKRCLQLAKHLKGNSLTIDERIKEMHFGDWEMKPWAEIDKEQIKYWMTHLGQASTPNGESNQDLFDRSVAFWQELMAEAPEEVGVVTHFGVMQSLLAHLLHIPLEKVFRIYLGYGAVIEVSIHDRQYYKIKFLK